MRAGVKFKYLTWSQIYTLLLRQASQIRASGFKPEVIVGISRGGWLPARVLSDLLENPNLANAKAEAYTGIAEAKAEPTLTQPVSVDVTGKRVLIVDEVADTGKSLSLIRDHVLAGGASEVRAATLFCKPQSVFKPDYCEKITSSWIVFPWEVKETLRGILQKNGGDPAHARNLLGKLERAGVPKRLTAKFLKEFSEGPPC
ncbi:MAG: phosphoribosyltransferase [Candidatus Bathyarchaeia archaeon]